MVVTGEPPWVVSSTRASPRRTPRAGSRRTCPRWPPCGGHVGAGAEGWRCRRYPTRPRPTHGQAGRGTGSRSCSGPSRQELLPLSADRSDPEQVDGPLALCPADDLGLVMHEERAEDAVDHGGVVVGLAAV